MPPDLPHDPARILADNEALNQQVRLLVQVEQRLYRSQNELNRQLQNMRQLGAFALACAGSDDVGTILERAVGVLAPAFTLEWLGALRLEPEAGQARLYAMDPPPPEDRPLPLSPDELAWLGGLPALNLFTLPDAGAEHPVNDILARLWPVEVPPPAQRRGSLLLMILRGGSPAPVAALLAYSTEKRRAMYWPADLSESNRPFLELFANHLERALENSALTADLRQRGAELADSLSELERAQARLLQAQKMEAIGQLAGGVAHDFNNILTVILGHASLCLDAPELVGARRLDIERIVAAGERAAAITGQLLAFGRRQVRMPESVDLNRLTRALTSMVERLIGEHVRLALDLGPGELAVWADPTQLEQILLNLVVNARDALPGGGTIRVTTRPASPADAARVDPDLPPAEFVVLEVSDNGVGMDDATRARIFEPFFTTKTDGQGTGLGLSVVYGIMQQSGGNILVESAPGQGARFTLLLPRSARPAAPPREPAPPPRPQGQASGAILVAEDEEMIRDIVAEFLGQAGYQVRAFEDGQAALEAFQAGAPADLLLTDLVMPRLGGLGLAEEIWRQRPGLPVVFMSGYPGDPSDPLPELTPTAAPPAERRYLMKPFTRAELLAAVAALLPAAPAPPAG